ncbi:hypothetical protein MASR1M50_08270 [Burkholderiales bacterium]
MAIPQHFIQELLARADIVEIVGRYVQLKKTGANFSGLCPFHGEKTPSFTVSPSKQFYHCFGCGKNGNAIGFLMDHTGAGFVETVHELAQQYGMPVPEDERSPAERARAAQETERRATLTDVLARAADAWRKQLKASPRAIDYLKRRGLSGEVARQFGLGYAPEGWRALASVFPDYGDALLVDSGLVIVSEDDEGKRYDRFRDRIMFPIRDVKGEVIGFGGRVLGDENRSTSTRPKPRCSTRAASCTACSRPARRCASTAMRWWSRATWTSSPWPSKVLATPWPRWARPARPSTCTSCFASPTRSCSASTATPPAGAPRTRRWKPPCPWPPTPAA